MDDRVKPPSWLPDAAAPAVSDETTADGSMPAVDDAGAGSAGYGYLDGGSYPATSYAANGDDEYGFGWRETASPDAPADDAHAPSYEPSARPYEPSSSPYVAQAAHRPQTPPQFPPEAGDVDAGPAHTASYSFAPGPPPPPPPQPAPTGRAAPRRANLVVARLDPWSVMKFSFLMSLAAWIVLVVAVAVIYYVLNRLGVFSSLQQTLQSVTSSQGSSGLKLSTYLAESKVLGYTMLLGAINIVIITVLSTIGAVIYNLVTHIGGGIEVTLKESD